MTTPDLTVLERENEDAREAEVEKADGAPAKVAFRKLTVARALVALAVLGVATPIGSITFGKDA